MEINVFIALALAFGTFMGGVAVARNVNEKDRQFWAKLGYDKAVEEFKLESVERERFGHSQFAKHGKLRYGEKRFMRMLDHLEVGGFSNEAN